MLTRAAAHALGWSEDDRPQELARFREETGRIYAPIRDAASAPLRRRA